MRLASIIRSNIFTILAKIDVNLPELVILASYKKSLRIFRSDDLVTLHVDKHMHSIQI